MRKNYYFFLIPIFVFQPDIKAYDDLAADYMAKHNGLEPPQAIISVRTTHLFDRNVCSPAAF